MVTLFTKSCSFFLLNISTKFVIILQTKKSKDQRGNYFPRLNTYHLFILSRVNQTLMEYNKVLGTGMIKLVRYIPWSLS